MTEQEKAMYRVAMKRAIRKAGHTVETDTSLESQFIKANCEESKVDGFKPVYVRFDQFAPSELRGKVFKAIKSVTVWHDGYDVIYNFSYNVNGQGYGSEFFE